MQIKKGDKVKVITGKDKGKSGIVLRVFPKLNKAIVEGINILKKHKKSNKQGEKGTILEIASKIDASNLKKEI